MAEPRELRLLTVARDVLRMLKNEIDGNGLNSRDERLHQARRLLDAVNLYTDIPVLRDADKHDPITEIRDPRRI